MLGIIIQARLGSKRLPNKMLLPFYKEKGVFEILIEKLKVHFSSIPIILATSLETTDDPLIAICEKHNLYFYRGSESNVLERFIDTAKHFKISKIIRICADNPFLDFDELENLKNEFINT